MSNNKRMSTQEMQALAAQSAAKPRTTEQVSPGDIVTGISIRRLRVLDVHQYENNPRKASSSALSSMLDSIRNAGLLNRLAVCRLPDGRFITAKGGGTRLEALHQLASEKDEQGRPTADAKRFEFLDFDEVPYTSETALLAAHLAENLERQDMCFWDTAVGVVMMRKEIHKELGRDLGSREFISELKKRGLSKVAPDNLGTYEYAVNQLHSLNSAVLAQISRNDVRDILRPALSLIESFWTKHSQLGEFPDMQQSWLSLYDAGPEASGYSAHALLSYLKEQLARHLGCEVSELERLLSAHKLDPEASIAQLKAESTPNPASTDAEGSEETEDQRVSREGLANLARSMGQANTLRTGLPEGVQAPAGEASDPGEGDGDAADHADLIAGGIKTAAPHQLQIKSPTGPLQVKDATGPSVGQAHLQGLDPRSSALQIMRTHLDQLADHVGIRDFVLDAPGMPYGFFMEIPPAGLLGADVQDLAVQGWWLLANLSGQLPADIDAFLASGALPDTGPDGYLQRLADVEAWQDIVSTSLGGQTLLDAGFMVHMLTRASEMAGLALDLAAAMKLVNDTSAGGAA